MLQARCFPLFIPALNGQRRWDAGRHIGEADVCDALFVYKRAVVCFLAFAVDRHILVLHQRRASLGPQCCKVGDPFVPLEKERHVPELGCCWWQFHSRQVFKVQWPAIVSQVNLDMRHGWGSRSRGHVGGR